MFPGIAEVSEIGGPETVPLALYERGTDSAGVLVYVGDVVGTDQRVKCNDQCPVAGSLTSPGRAVVGVMVGGACLNDET
jgi:hypothetical protein